MFGLKGKFGGEEMYIGGDLVSGQVAILEILQARLGSDILDRHKRCYRNVVPLRRTRFSRPCHSSKLDQLSVLVQNFDIDSKSISRYAVQSCVPVSYCIKFVLLKGYKIRPRETLTKAPLG